MAQLARQKDDLAAVVPLVCDEIAKDMTHVERQISPNIGSRGRNASAVLAAKLQQAGDSPTASIEAH
jgi:hypothetical protein